MRLKVYISRDKERRLVVTISNDYSFAPTPSHPARSEPDGAGSRAQRRSLAHAANRSAARRVASWPARALSASVGVRRLAQETEHDVTQVFLSPKWRNVYVFDHRKSYGGF